MRRFLILPSFLAIPFLLISDANSCSKKTPPVSAVQEYTVSGTITQTQSYCGGARPPEDLLKALESPRPYRGKKICFRSGDKNNTDQKFVRTAVSDSLGKFSVKLPAGAYCIIEEDQVKLMNVESYRKKYGSKYLTVDEDCLKSWWGTCIQSFVLGNADKNDLTLNFHMACFTNGVHCLRYTGPLPQ